MLKFFFKYAALIITIKWVFSETSPAQVSRCFIPNQVELQNLTFKLHPQNETTELGSSVENYETVHIECKNGYTLKGQSTLMCNNGKWSFDFPHCDDYCDGKLLKMLSLTAICDFGQQFIECPKRIAPGTSIQLNCAFGYTRKSKTVQFLQCSDGSFDKNPQRCEHNCGKIATSEVVLSKNGIQMNSSLAPWHVPIYEHQNDNYNYVCSGSIISPTIILTAAHCFWDDYNLIARNYTRFEVIAGKNTKNYTTVQNEYIQRASVLEIHIPLDYTGKSGRQNEDIGFLKLATPLKYSITIAPICLPEETKISASSYMLSNKKGFINNFDSQNRLEKLTMTTMSYHDCIQRSSEHALMSDDKFCIYNSDGVTVGRGASGGGFYMEIVDPLTNEITYTLLGVISHKMAIKNDDKPYFAITNIFNLSPEFRKKLADAIKQDEALY